jgi:Glycosyltransferase family 87
LALAAAFGTLVTALLLLPNSTSIDKDFGQEYVLARAIRDGIDPYQSVRELGTRYVTPEGNFNKEHPTPHPPTVGLLALPLSFSSYGDAALLWLVIELACLYGCALLLLRKNREPPLLGLMVALALIGWPPMTLELGLGQLTLPMLLGILAAQWALQSGHRRLGGALLGATLIVKPLGWPLLLLLAVRREWQALSAAALVVVLSAGAAVVAIGVEHSAGYVLRVLPTLGAMFQTEPTNMALSTVGARVGIAWLGPLAAAAVVVLGTWWSGKRTLEVGLAMMTTVSLLASPLSWSFYFVLALVPIGYLIGWYRQFGAPKRDAWACLAAVALISIPQARLGDIARWGAGAASYLLPTLGLIMIGLLIARAGDQPPAIAPITSNGSVPAAMGGGSGFAGGSSDRS